MLEEIHGINEDYLNSQLDSIDEGISNSKDVESKLVFYELIQRIQGQVQEVSSIPDAIIKRITDTIERLESLIPHGKHCLEVYSLGKIALKFSHGGIIILSDEHDTETSFLKLS